MKRHLRLLALATLLGPGLVRAAPQMKTADVELLQSAAAAGDPEAQFLVGYTYETGDGFSKDPANAARWYRRAATAGNPEAQNALGRLLAEGLGEPKNPEAAVQWFLTAAAKGNADARFNLGNMYANGTGVPQSDREAMKWYRLAATQGDADAALLLKYFSGKAKAAITRFDRKAVVYLRGLGAQTGAGPGRKTTGSLGLIREAAEQGQVDAQFHLGSLYAKGQFVARDPVQAYLWFYISLAGGSPSAQRALNEIERTMTPEQLTQAEARSLRWAMLNRRG